MPTTFAGIGTRYYGKTSLRAHRDVCPRCLRLGDLQSYATRLWFTFLFLPLLPLRRRQIVDECPACGHHQTVDVETFEKQRRDRIEQAVSYLKSHPDDPTAVVELHRVLESFGETTQANELLHLMAERFGHNPRVLSHVGSARGRAGDKSRAAEASSAAYQLDPNLPETKVATAAVWLNEGRLDDARGLLASLPLADPQVAALLLALAEKYQADGRPQDAYPSLQRLLQQFPELAHDRQFRNTLQASATASGAGPMPLPRLPRNWKRAAAWAVVAVVIVGGLVVSNYYLSRNRTIHVLNALPQPVQVTIDGTPRATVAPGKRVPVEVAEGKHQATFSGAVTQSFDFNVEGGVSGRWLGDYDYFLNPGGAALLVSEQTTYSAEPKASGAGGNYQLHFGKPFVRLAKADYLFAEFPREIQLENKKGSMKKRRIDQVMLSPTDIFYSLIGEGNTALALDLAEWHLALHPEASDILPAYVGLCLTENGDARARSYLATRIARRPVDIQWHRMYQELETGAVGPGPLLQQYDSFLAADPTNSALLYLRGRLSSGNREASDYYRRAIAADAGNGFAHYALGYGHAAAGDWAAASPLLRRAVELRPNDPQMQELFVDARLALQEQESLLKELEQAHAQDPYRFSYVMHLGQLMAATGRTNELDQMLKAYRERVQQRFGEEGKRVGERLEARIVYAQGNLEALLQLAERDSSPEGQLNRFQALVEAGRLTNSTLLLPPQTPLLNEPLHLLAVSLAFELAGQANLAKEWRDETLHRMNQARPEFRQAALMLQSEVPVSLEDVMSLSLSPQSKAVLLVWLARRFPEKSSEFKTAARKLNFHLDFPYHLVRRLAADQAS